MALFSLICLLCAIGTNVPNVVCFVFLVLQYCLLAAQNWVQADGQTAIAANLQTVSTSYI